MRESLTVLAGIVVLILSAALAVPYFVNWSAQRGLVERQLSEVLGRPVTIRGGIDLKLLPTPYLRLADVDLGSAAAKPEVKADEIQLEIALTPLLRGEVDFVEAKLVHPQVALTIEDGNLRLGPPLRGLSGAMRFERIAVEDGTLVITDPEVQRSYRLDDISFSAEAGSLTGPFKADGHFSYAGSPTRFRLGTGDLARGDKLHVKLILDENAQHPRADVDADLQFAKDSLPSLDGQITLAERNDAQTGDAQMPWQLSAHVKAVLRQASLDTIDLRIGDEDHGFDLAGVAAIDFGAKPDAHAVLKAKQIDLDRLLSRKDGPSAMQRVAAAGAAFVKSNRAMPSAMPLRVEVAADTVLLGGETLSHLSAALNATGKQAVMLRFDGNGPGRSHLNLDGKLETGDAAGFVGRVAARAGDAQRLKQWFATNLPQSKALFAAMPMQSFDVSGDGNLSAVGFVGQNLTLKLDQTHLAGTLAYTQAVGSEPSRLFADLTSDRLDLASLPDIEGFAAHAGAMDLSLRLDARSVNIGSLGQAHPGQGLATGRIQLRLEKTGAVAKLDQFAITSLGGANVAAHGQWDGQKGTIAATLDSEKLAAAAELLQRLAPGPWSELLSARADVLAPAHLTLSANLAKTSSGKDSQDVALADSDLGGTIGGTKISAQVTADPKDPQSLDVIAMASSPDVLALLRQFGIATLPLQNSGAGEIKFSASGKLGEAFASKLTASLAGTDIAFDGDLQGDLAAPQARGTLHLTSADLTGLLQATGLAFPDPAARLPADLQASLVADRALVDLNHVAGHIAGAQLGGHVAYDVASSHATGALDTDHLSFAQFAALAFGPPTSPKPGALWSSTKFTPAMVDPPPVDLAITAKSFDLWPHLTGHDARFDLSVSGGRAGLKLALSHTAMKLTSGSLDGDITLRRDGANAAATARLKLADYDLTLPSLRGRLSGTIDIAGTGDNPQVLITSLAGSGTLTFSDLVLPRTDPGALAHVLQASEDDDLTLDGNEIERALSREFDKGSAHLGAVAFDAGLAGGTLRLTPKGTAEKRLDPGVTETLQMSLDTTNLMLDQKSHLTLVALPKDWNGSAPAVDVAVAGPLTNPARTIQSAGFLNALAARAIARESARIQAQEFDIHEQAFFYNRLTFERRSEEERVRAIEEAKRAAVAKAEAEAKAKAVERAKAAVEGRSATEPSAAVPGAAKPEALHVAPTTHAEIPSATVQKVKPGEARAKPESESRAPATLRPGPHALPLHATPSQSVPLRPAARKPASIVRRQPKPEAQTPRPAQQTPKPNDPLAAGPF